MKSDIDSTRVEPEPRPLAAGLRRGALIVLCGLLTLELTGCHRGFYRRQADSDARFLIRQKLNDPRWNQLDPSIAINPQSRMYDPFSADHPPQPPDDAASQKLMQCVDGKRGYPNWNANGNTPYVSNPDWRSYLPLNPLGYLELDSESAVRLSLLNSPDWQEQKETLFVSALNVSLERFAFDTQGFWGWDIFGRTQGRKNAAVGRPGGVGSMSSLDLTRRRTELTRLGVTGTNLVVSLANTIIWRFAGTEPQSASTLIDVSLIQPLLRRAGRERIMEALTQSERTLLANVRQLERYRRGFFLFVTTGRSPGAGPNLSGNFLGSPGSFSGQAGGYLGLLLQQQSIRISEFNVQSLQNVLDQFREFFAEERIDLLQVVQAETQVYRAQENLLVSKVQYENSLDQFKRDLGLPPDVPILVDDPYLSRFELIDDQLLARQLQITALRDNFGEQLERISPFRIDDQGNEQDIEWTPQLQQNLQQLIPFVDAIYPLFEQLSAADVALVRRDFERLSQSRQERIRKLQNLREYIETSEIEFEIEPALLLAEEIETAEQLAAELQDLETRFSTSRRTLDLLKENIRQLIADGPALAPAQLKQRLEDDVFYEAPEILTQVANAAIELNLLQARARVDSVTLPDVEITADDAFAIALQFRRDLMNARASLVDAWRNIEFVADDLESTLDVVFEGNVGNVGNDPFAVDWNTNRFALGLRFDAPITRLSERNAYRVALIEYQQARRAYYNFEDQINQNMRRAIRALNQSRVLFQLSRRSVKTAVQQVELAQFALIEPSQPGQGGGAQSLGPTASRNLTDALNILAQNQTQFVRIWVDYETLRRELDFDMGTMQLAPDGSWMDPGVINVNYAWRVAESLCIPTAELVLPPPVTGPRERDLYGPDPDAILPGAPLDAPAQDAPAQEAPAQDAPALEAPALQAPGESDDPGTSSDGGPRLGFVPQWIRDMEARRAEVGASRQSGRDARGPETGKTVHQR